MAILRAKLPGVLFGLQQHTFLGLSPMPEILNPFVKPFQNPYNTLNPFSSPHRTHITPETRKIQTDGLRLSLGPWRSQNIIIIIRMGLAGFTGGSYTGFRITGLRKKKGCKCPKPWFLTLNPKPNLLDPKRGFNLNLYILYALNSQQQNLSPKRSFLSFVQKFLPRRSPCGASRVWGLSRDSNIP